jgi:hypothetical protein
MSRDCNIPQCDGDDVEAECNFVNMAEIKGIVKEQIDTIKSRKYGQVCLARAKLASVSQLPLMSAFLL